MIERSLPWVWREMEGRGASTLLRVLWRGGLVCRATLWAACRLVGREGTEADMALWARRVLDALGVSLHVERPWPSGGRMVVSNHLSWLDPLAVLAAQPCLPLAKAEVAAYPVIGGLARRAGLRFVAREHATDRTRALRQVQRDLQAGRRVLLFPEGTTTQGQRLAPLCRGGLGLAYRLGLDVQTVRLTSPDAHYPWVGDATLGPHLLDLLRAPATHLHLSPGPCLRPLDYPDLGAWLHVATEALTPEWPREACHVP